MGRDKCQESSVEKFTVAVKVKGNVEKEGSETSTVIWFRVRGTDQKTRSSTGGSRVNRLDVSETKIESPESDGLDMCRGGTAKCLVEGCLRWSYQAGGKEEVKRKT